MDTCQHDRCVRVYTFWDMLRDYWRMWRGLHSVTPEESTGSVVCLDCGRTLKR